MAASAAMLVVALCSSLCLLGVVVADTPVNCTYEDIRGTWTFQLGKNGDKTIDCSDFTGPTELSTSIELQYPDLAMDENGNQGFWTIIYNQGFEIVIHGRKYFAFSKYEGQGENVTSFCDQIMPGWSHDVLGHDWMCMTGKKWASAAPKVSTRKGKVDRSSADKGYRHDPEFINKINSAQKLWTAAHYPEFEKLTRKDMIRMAGGEKSRIAAKPRAAPVTPEQRKLADTLPTEFDWRNVSGVNFVSPVRNQDGCGSCYAFAAMAMYEARLKIHTDNKQSLVMSPQDVVECSQYSQGCDGGFPYLIGGKYAEDYGVVEESCNPYIGATNSTTCNTDPSCKRHYATDYKYVGGYYGGCNEEAMRLSLVNDGPMAVAFEVYDDFFQYTGGIYHHSGVTRRFEPFELTNHAVTLVGYGVDAATGTKFWTVKNSWGATFGESGYFRIVRGRDECAIESVAVEALPIF